MPVVPTLDVEKYLDFKTMTHYLKAVSSAAPHLVRVFSIGKSKAGRPLLVAEVTNRNLAEGRQKPGLWIDGGHQGWSLLGSTACLELIRFLVAGHGRDEFLTDLVDHNVFYIAPRLAPDEMEICLKDGALVTQGSEKSSQSGRQFRIKNPLGSWKSFKRDNRILVPRNPEDRKGPFYDLHRHFDESTELISCPRDFPMKNSAHLPLQQASTRAVFEFMKSYSNVFAVISTSGPGDRVEIVTQSSDSKLVRQLGKRLSDLAGLPLGAMVQSLERSGDFLSWASTSLGVLAVDCQMWSLRGAAGLKESDLENPFQAEETELMQLLRFCEKEFPEESFSEWKEFEDPALGKGEIGGWDWSKTWLNPPTGPYLARELKKLSRLALGLASASPRLKIAKLEEEIIGWSEDREALRHLRVTVENQGYLPTCPLETGQDMGGKLKLDLGSNSILMGNTVEPLQELRGSGLAPDHDAFSTIREKLQVPSDRDQEREFLIKGSDPVEVSVVHPLAGLQKLVSKPPQKSIPSFGSAEPAPQQAKSPAVEETFEEAFPSFEELYQEEEKPAPPPPPPPPPPALPRLDEPVPPPPPLPRVEEPQAPSVASGSSEFNIPDPAQASPSQARPVTFGQLDPPAEPKSNSPFPSKKPSQGRVFGSPPQKPTGGLPMGLGGAKESRNAPIPEAPQESEFSPLPLVKSQETNSSAFEPMLPLEHAKPIEDIASADTIDRKPEASRETKKMPRPSAPPPRMSRMSAPQLLRRQRGNQGSRESFKPR